MKEVNESNTNDWEERFDAEFMCHVPEHIYQSDHQFSHEVQGRLPQAFKEFLNREIALAEARGEARGAEKVVEEIPDEQKVLNSDKVILNYGFKKHLRSKFLTNSK